MPIGTTNFPTSLDTAVELVEVADNALTTLSAELSAVATTASVVSTTAFPTTGILTIEDEKISYTGKTGTTFTGLTRGVGGTSAAIHALAENVECLIVEEWHRVHSAAIIAIETKLGAGAAIAVNKLAALTASIVPVTDASGFLSSSAVTPTELGHLTGVTSAIQTQLGAKQGLDATLTALAAYNTNGLLTQTAADTFAGRTITGTASRLAVTNGNGVAGNPTLDIDAGYVGQASITTLGTITTGVWNGTAIGASFIGDLSAVYSPVAHNHTGVYQPLDTDLTDIAALTLNGLLRKSAGTWAMDSATYLTANQTITLSGDVTGSGTTAITTTIGAGVVTNAMLAGSIAYSKLSLTGAILNADLAGSIAYSKLSLTGAILNADLAGSIAISKLSITGTPDGTKFLRDDGSWQTAGGGTITGADTQVLFFDGTDNPAGDAGMTFNKTTNALTLTGPLTTTQVAVGFSGGVYAFIAPAWASNATFFGDGGGTMLNGAGPGVIIDGASPALRLGSGIQLTGGASAFQIQGTGVSLLSANVGTSPNVLIAAQGAAFVPIILRGAASQSANLTEWQNNAATVLASVGLQGYFTFPGGLRILGYTTVAGVPTTTELPNDKDCAIHKNSTSGVVSLAYNDGGAIKKIDLA